MHKETPFTSNAFYSSQDFSFAAYWFHPRTVWFLKSFFSKGLKWAAATRSLQFTKILNHHNHYSCSFHNIVRSDKLHRPTMLLKRRKTRFKLYTNPCGQLGIVGQSFLRKNLSPTVDYYSLSMMIALVPFNIIKYLQGFCTSSFQYYKVRVCTYQFNSFTRQQPGSATNTHASLYVFPAFSLSPIASSIVSARQMCSRQVWNLHVCLMTYMTINNL